MASNPPTDTALRPLKGPERPLAQFLTTFHLVLIVVDPFTNESAWLLETGARIVETFGQADCRVGWLCTGDPDECREFLGPLAVRFLTFSDPQREFVKALGLEHLPAIVHIGMDGTVIAAAEGWTPRAWHVVTEELADMLRWTGPRIPAPGDPSPFPGSPALG